MMAAVFGIFYLWSESISQTYFFTYISHLSVLFRYKHAVDNFIYTKNIFLVIYRLEMSQMLHINEKQY